MSNSDITSETLWMRIASGSVGSILTALVVTPLEVVKVRQQFQTPLPRTASISVPLRQSLSPCPCCGVFIFNNGLKECILPRNAVPYFDPSTGKLKENLQVSRSTGTLSMLRNIWKTEGAAGIYAGLTPTLVMGIPNTVLYFTSYEELKHRINHLSLFSTSVVPAIAGASARLVASCATAPLELIKTRQAAQIGGGQHPGGLLVELQTMIRVDGFWSLYRGLSPTLMRDIPFSAVYWYCIEDFRSRWEYSDHHVTALEQGGRALINGSAAGMIAAAISTPLDVVKTRRQVMPTVVEAYESTIGDHGGAMAYRTDPSSRQPMGTLATMNKIIAEEGISGLWRGNQTRMIKVAPACAIMLSSYEIGKRLLSES